MERPVDVMVMGVASFSFFAGGSWVAIWLISGAIECLGALPCVPPAWERSLWGRGFVQPRPPSLTFARRNLHTLLFSSRRVFIPCGAEALRTCRKRRDC